MCVMSMVMQHRQDDWGRRIQEEALRLARTPTPPVVPPVTDREILEFRELLERARKYDREHNQPDCEMEEKKKKLMELAEQLGIADKVSFINESLVSG